MRSLYLAASIMPLFLVQGAVAAESSGSLRDWLFGPSVQTTEPGPLAEAKQPKSGTKPSQPPQGAAAPPPQQQQAPQNQPAARTETTNFDNWILNCREF